MKLFWILDLGFSIERSRSKTLLSFALCSLLLALWALPLALSTLAEAREAGKVYRIGYLSVRTAARESDRITAFKEGLRALGYAEGKNIVIELRRALAGQREKLSESADQLVRLKVDIIVTTGGISTQIAKEKTNTIPIVFTVSADPVGDGLVASLARPGGNVTGLSDLHSVLVTKRLELLKETVPTANRLGVLLNPAFSAHPRQLKDIQAAAPAFGMTVLSLPVTRATEIDRAFVAMRNESADGLLVLGDPVITRHRQQTVDLAIKNRLPAIFPTKGNVTQGGLMSYGTNFIDLWRRAAVYVDKILKGARPADLPVEQPTQFEFIINLNTAKQIGLTIPPNVLARADQVIR